jgi:LacI family transcriptional regulator
MPKIPKVILLIDTARSYGRGLLEGIAKYSNLHGPWIFYWKAPFYRESGGRELSLARLRGLNADGIIMREQKKTREVLALGLPTIISPYKNQFAGLPNIVTDDVTMGKMAAKHLLNRGFQNFAYCGFEDMFGVRSRGESFCSCVAKAGFKASVYKEPKSRVKRLWTNEQNVMAEWLKSLPKPVGLMACNDDRARHVTEACKIAGLHVPEEVAIIGVDNDELVCNLSSPPLSSIVLNFERAGYEAAELLDKLMAGKKRLSKSITVSPTHTITRQSTDILATEDSEVAGAIRYIRQNANRAIQVDDVVNVVTVSRRGLERRFRKVLNRSVLDEIKRVRIDLVAKMLVETNLSVSQIALKLGYSGAENIARYFRQEKGISPIVYREKYGRR